MKDVFGDGVFASLPDDQRYEVDPADPQPSEVWAHTGNTDDYLTDDRDADAVTAAPEEQ